MSMDPTQNTDSAGTYTFTCEGETYEYSMVETLYYPKRYVVSAPGLAPFYASSRRDAERQMFSVYACPDNE
jgi:hypothetical protein